MARRYRQVFVSVIAVLPALVVACDPVGPRQTEVSVTGTVYFDSVPDSGWRVYLNRATTSSGGCMTLDGCGAGYAWVGDTISSADGTFTIGAVVDEDACGSLFLSLGARDEKPHTVIVEDRRNVGIACGFSPGHDFTVRSGWPWEPE